MKGEREALCIAAIVGLCSQQLLLVAGSSMAWQGTGEKEVSCENKRKDIRGCDVDPTNDKSDIVGGSVDYFSDWLSVVIVELLCFDLQRGRLSAPDAD